MICPQCGAQDQHGTFCNKCGAPLDEDMGDFTRVMPALEREDEGADYNDTRYILTENAHPSDTQTSSATDAEVEPTTNDETHFYEKPPIVPDDMANTGEYDPLDMTSLFDGVVEEPLDEEAMAKAQKQAKLDAWLHDEEVDVSEPALPAVYDDGSESHFDDDEEEEPSVRRKVITIVALFVGILLAALAAIYLFTSTFDTTPKEDPSAQVKNADTIAPDKTLAEDTIVGHWRHYNQGSQIEKIGTARYRWTIGKKVYQLDFKDNQYIYEDDYHNTYNFVLTSADRLQLASSATSSDGIIANPIFDAGYMAGRVAEDGTMTQNMTINADAFGILGKTYAELAGLYGPGALTVIGDDQYIVFRANGGNFAVQFTGDTVPLSTEEESDYEIVKLTSSENTETVTEGGSSSSSSSSSDSDTKEYTVEIPDMPTFPSTSAVATGTLWCDLGFVVNNCPSVMTVEDLAAIFGIALETGDAPDNLSGFTFYGMEEGYFAGTYAYDNHSFYVSGYGNSALSAEKTTIFIQQIS